MHLKNPQKIRPKVPLKSTSTIVSDDPQELFLGNPDSKKSEIIPVQASLLIDRQYLKESWKIVERIISIISFLS